MAKPFKFRYVNEIVGAFVLLGLIVLLGAILLAGRAQQWFVPTFHLQLTFPPDTTFGLRDGSKVQILETPVGGVRRIVVDSNGQIFAEAVLRGDLVRLVRCDSKAIVRRQFGVAGDAYVEITKGEGAPLSREGASLQCSKDTSITDTLEEVIEQVREATLPAIEQAQRAVEEYTNLAAELRSPESELQQFIKHLNTLAADLERGEGTAGRLLRDSEMAEELVRITQQINETLAEVNRILADVKETTAQLPEMAAVVGSEMRDVPGTVVQVRETLRETERLLVGVQQHWLLRRYVEKGEPAELISPAALGIGGAP